MGRSHCSGRVELLHKENRHTVCDAAFDWQDAEVVCRELDCGAPVEVLGAAAFGEGKGQVWSEEIQCGGNETHIQLCPTSALNINCSHDRDVGLVCSGKPMFFVSLNSRHSLCHDVILCFQHLAATKLPVHKDENKGLLSVSALPRIHRCQTGKWH